MAPVSSETESSAEVFQCGDAIELDIVYLPYFQLLIIFVCIVLCVALLRYFVVRWQEFIREGCLFKVDKSGPLPRMFFLV